MTAAVLVTILLTISPPMAASGQAEPSTRELAASVTVFSSKELAASVTVFYPTGSVTLLTTEEKVADQTVVTIGSDVLFDFGSATLTPDATAKIEEVAGRIVAGAQPVAVVGYTDSVGDEATNVALSVQRANAVSSVLRLAAPSGVQVTTEGRGEREPIASNRVGGKDSPEGRARNRRVSISFTAV